jgi:glycerophosphoryl diester phosphodiesterase
VAATPRAELPAQVVSVPELYAALGSDFDLSLDVKAPTAFLPAAAAAQAVGAADRLWACGTLADVVRWREQDMGVRLVHSTRAARLGQQVEAHARLLAQRGVDALNLPRQDWTSNRVRAVQQAGVRAFGWDCHTIASAGQLLGWGCDGVYGDDVDVLLDAAARYAI